MLSQRRVEIKNIHQLWVESQAGQVVVFGRRRGIMKSLPKSSR